MASEYMLVSTRHPAVGPHLPYRPRCSDMEALNPLQQGMDTDYKEKILQTSS